MEKTRYHAAIFIAVLCFCPPCYGLEETHYSSVSAPIPSPSHLSYITIESTPHSVQLQYHAYDNAPVMPYIAFGDSEEGVEPYPEERFWHEHSYESLQLSAEKDRWAGFKIRLHEMFRLDVDTKQRKVHSTFSLAPKTKMRVRANFKEIKAELRYQF
jgi:hypothetical protein